MKIFDGEISLKQFRVVKMIVVILLALFISQMIIQEEYFLSVIGIAIALLLLLFFKGRVREVMADERDYEVGGRSAILAIQLFSQLGVLGMFLFWGFKDKNASFEVIGYMLAYTVSLLMLLYAFIARFYHRIRNWEGKIFYVFLALIFLVLVLLGGRSVWGW